MPEIGLNLFQRLARRWEAVHPYNAAQVLRVAGHVDPSAAGEVWAESLRTLGLGRVRILQDARFQHEVLNGEMARYPLRVLPAETSLASHLTTELNRRFDDPDEPPFRPFLCQRADDFYFGVVYQHWVGDSVAIRCVLREWFTRLFDPAAARRAPLRQPYEGYLHLFGRRGGWRLDEALLSGFRQHMRHRRVRKVRTEGPRDYPVRVSLHESPVGLIERLRSIARADGLKLHDLLLAALTEACDRHVPAQHRRNRPDLSVGSIVDLRRRAAADLNDTFGLYLGFANVVCRRETLKEWDKLVRCVAAQNRLHKSNGLAQASMMWMLAGLAVSPFLTDRTLYKFYRKELPMAGGLSNVNLNESWAARYYPEPLLDYIRVSPTGPLVPLVFSTTTLGSRFSVAMTCREALLSPHAADEMVGSFLDRLARVCVDNPPQK